MTGGIILEWMKRLMSSCQGEFLCLLWKTITTVTRRAISPHERLSATLQFLATGRNLWLRFAEIKARWHRSNPVPINRYNVLFARNKKRIRLLQAM